MVRRHCPQCPGPLIISIVVALALVVAAAAVGSSVGSHAMLVIGHQQRGCHVWAISDGVFKPSQTVALRRGGWISVTNNDVMPHQLVERSGPAVAITRLSPGMAGANMGLEGRFPPVMLARLGAAAKLVFSKAAVYHFTTKPGEDFIAGIKTVGPDNVLKLTVVVR